MSKSKKSFERFMSYSFLTKVVLILFFLFFLVEAIIHLFPFVITIFNSFKTNDAYYADPMGFPFQGTFQNYAEVFEKFIIKGGIGYGTMFLNSLWQTSLYLVANILSSTLLAYAIAKFKFPGRNLLYGIMIFTQTIPIIGSGVISYKLLYGLGMINNPLTIWYYWAFGFDFSAFIMYGTFQSVSNSYSESATIDGAGDFQIFIKIVFPLVFPCIVALLVTNFCTMWNNYTVSQITLNAFPNLAYGLYVFQKSSQYYENSKGIFYSALILTSLPGVVFYALTQNQIIKNISVGGIKG